MKARTLGDFAFLFFGAFWIILSLNALGYDFMKVSKWPDGEIKLTYNLGSSPVFFDGKTPNETADIAASLWNPFLGRVQFSGIDGPMGSSAANNGQNNVFFASDIRGVAFGEGVVAVTLIYERSGIKEADVIVNSAISWNSFRGELGSGPLDLRRALVHEFGHVLGLAHPDEARQNENAIMNSVLASIGEPQVDDQFGAALLYGLGVSSPKLVITEEPRDVQTYEGEENASFYVWVWPTVGVTYQWFRNGIAIPDAKNARLSLPLVTLDSAGLYSVEAKNAISTVMSRSAKLTVDPLPPPTITRGPQSEEHYEGETASLSVVSSGNGRLFEWFKNGVPIAGEKNSSLYIASLKFSDEGDYSVRVYNRTGSVMSNSARLSVSQKPPPPIAELNSKRLATGDMLSISISAATTDKIQWYKDGAPINGETSLSYFKRSVTVDDVGEYAVLVTNSSGSTISQRARVDVVGSSAATPNSWVGLERNGDIVYVAYESPAKIERYSLKLQQWLTPLKFENSITAFSTRGSALYIAFGRSVSVFNLEGGSEKKLFTQDKSIGHLFSTEKWLISSAMTSDYGSPVNLYSLTSDNGLVPYDSYYLKRGFSYDEATGRLFGISVGLTQSNVARGKIADNGKITIVQSSPYNSGNNFGSKTFLLPGGKWIVDNTGAIFEAESLQFVRSIDGFSDINSTADEGLVTLSDVVLTYYDAQWNRSLTGRLKKSAQRLVVDDGRVFAFASPLVQGGATGCEIVPLADLSSVSVAPAPVLDGSSVNYVPEEIMLDHEGNVLLFAPLHRQVFRWSPQKRDYIGGVGLKGMPTHVAFAHGSQNLFVAYIGRRLARTSLLGGGDERDVSVALDEIRNLSATDQFAVAFDDSGAWGSYSVYTSEGVRLDRREWSYYGRYPVWNPKSRRLYYFSDSMTPRKLVYTEISTSGEISSARQSNFYDELNLKYPIRVSADGDSILLGSGVLYSSGTLLPTRSLGFSIRDGAWQDGALFTVRNPRKDLIVERWSGANFIKDKEIALPGLALRILPLPSGEIVVVHSRGGRVVFTILSPELNVVYSNADVNSSYVNISSRSRVGAGSDVMIAGFVVGGTGTQKVLVRAVGPKLSSFGLSGFLTDPKLEIFDSKGNKILTNDDWAGVTANVQSLQKAFEASGAFNLDLGSRDAAALAELSPGAYTVVVSGVAEQQGQGLVEVYVIDAESTNARLVNISTRAKVGTGADVLIGGFVVGGKAPKQVLVRGVGPGLIPLGLTGVLSNPKLKIYSGDSVVAENDDWVSSSGLAAVFTKSGAFGLPDGSKDAALVTTLLPGAYTVIVEGVNNTTGVAIVEVYEVPE